MTTYPHNRGDFNKDSFWTPQVPSDTSSQETRSLSEHTVFCAWKAHDNVILKEDTECDLPQQEYDQWLSYDHN